MALPQNDSNGHGTEIPFQIGPSCGAPGFNRTHGTNTVRRKRKQMHTLRAENITSDFYQYIDVGVPCRECDCAVHGPEYMTSDPSITSASRNVGQFCIDFGDSFGAAKLLNEPLFPVFDGSKVQGQGDGMKPPIAKLPLVPKKSEFDIEWCNSHELVGLDLSISSRATARRPKRRCLQKHDSFSPSRWDEYSQGESQRTPDQSTIRNCRSATTSPTEPKWSETDVTMIGARRKITYAASDDIDLSRAMGIPQSECTEESMEKRRLAIKERLKKNGHVSFSTCEEYDIHCRAEDFVKSVNPDREFCFPQGSSAPRDIEDSSILSILSAVSCVEYEKPEGDLSALSKPGAERKRRRHSCGDVDCYVVHPSMQQVTQSKEDGESLLPEGLCLLRPPNKLVELVAQAINDSPDGMLQVQQVYLALQNKYPYFQYMDKASMTSWRSSIRHALYQKWFRKIQLSTELINCKGCYWAINRRYQPREWTLPPSKDILQDTTSDDEKSFHSDEDNLASVSTIIDGLLGVGSSFNPQDFDIQESKPLPHEAYEEPSGPLDLSVCLAPSLPSGRDPDPMLAAQNEYEALNSQELSNDSSVSGGSQTGSMGLISDSDDGKCLHNSSDSNEPQDFYVSSEWGAALDPSLGSALSLSYHAPLLPPFCVSYSIVPPIDLVDSNTSTNDGSMDTAMPFQPSGYHKNEW